MQKTNTLPEERTLFNINNWSYWLFHNGETGGNPNGDGGGIYPRGTATAIFKDGIIWGAKINNDDNDIRVGGQTYDSGTQPLLDRIYRIRPDWKTLTTENVRQETSEFFMIDINAVTDDQANEIIDQYKNDWKNWPVNEGAPYVDVNENGVYDPVLDDDQMPDPAFGDYPGIVYASQVIWLKANDLDPARTINLYGSNPMGIELELTVWGYKHPHSILDQAIFKKYKITNISSDVFDEMYLSQWSDPDIGFFTDDLVGCDSDLNTAFAYNGGNSDSDFDYLGIAPPAVAYTLLYGPIVPSQGDVAVFDSRLIPNYKNLPLTSFSYFSGGTEWSDPDLGSFSGTLQWYNLLRGYLPNTNVNEPSPFINRNTGEETKYPLNGDPVTGIGDIDGQNNNLPPGDRRICLNSGPFTLAPNESQEMIVALSGGHGKDYLNSIYNLLTYIDYYYDIFRHGFSISELKAPLVTWNVNHPNNTYTNLELQADLNFFEAVTECIATIYPEFGDNEPINLTLYDDGMHSDNAAGDNVWGNSILTENRKYPHSCNLNINSASGPENYNRVAKQIRLRPIPTLQNWRFIWENKYLDSKVNNEETVHLQFDIKNNDAVNSIDTLSIYYERRFETNEIILPQDIRPIDSFFLIISNYGQGESVNLGYRLYFDNQSVYINNNFPVIPFNEDVGSIEVIHEGVSDGHLNVKIVDKNQLTGDQYKVYFEKNNDKNYWYLQNMTTGELLLEDITIIDGVDISTNEIVGDPIIDGLLIRVAGSYDAPNTFIDIIKNNSYSIAGRQLISDFYRESWADNARSTSTRGFGTTDLGELGQDYEIRWTGEIKSEPSVIHGISVWEVEESGGSMASLYGARLADLKDHPLNPNFGTSQPFLVRIPFEVWNKNTGEQINISIYDRIQEYNGSMDIYAFNPNDRMYTEFVNTPYDPDNVILENGGIHADHFTWNIVWWGNVNINTDDILNISYNSPLTPDDYFIFDAVPVTNLKNINQPFTYHLSQNFPNPFNPITKIDYQLPKISKVEITLYNLLGQKVRTLVNKNQAAGSYSILFDSSGLASGVYLYRLQANSFVITKKMALIK